MTTLEPKWLRPSKYFGVGVSREPHSLENISKFPQLREVGVIRRRRRRRRMTQLSWSCENFRIVSGECGLILFTCFKIFLRTPRVPGHSTQIKSEKKRNRPSGGFSQSNGLVAFNFFLSPRESAHWDKSHPGGCPNPWDTSHQRGCPNPVD